MKKFLLTVFSAALLSCGPSSTEKANDLLNEARTAMNQNRYEDAYQLIDSLRRTYPKEIDFL